MHLKILLRNQPLYYNYSYTTKMDNLSEVSDSSEPIDNSVDALNQNKKLLGVQDSSTANLRDRQPKANLNVFRQNSTPSGSGLKRSNTISSQKKKKGEVSSRKSTKSLYYNNGNEQLRDSDMESQMDDYMIQSVSSTSSDETNKGHGHQDSSESEPENESSEEDDYGEKVDPHKVVLAKMESFYDKNYKNYNVCSDQDVVDTKVWNLFYDQKIDYVYVFVAKVKQIRGEIQKSNFNLYLGKGQQQHVPTEEFDVNKQNQEILINEKPSYYYVNCHVSLDLVLQVWNVDDRIMRDKDHRQRAMATFKVIHTTVLIPEKMNTFQHMNYLQNRYQDYAQILQNDNKIHFFTMNNSLETYDTKLKTNFTGKFKDINEDYSLQNARSFQNYLHYKEIGTPGQGIESLFQFKLVVYEKKKDDDRSPITLSQRKNLAQLKQASEVMRQNFKTMLVLSTINYGKYLMGKQTQRGKQQRSIKMQKEENLTLRDDSILKYYLNTQGHVKPFFLQRLMDSSIYLLIFPTGHLLLINSSPLKLEGEIKLNMKKDEKIIDYCYCISDNYKNHCVWLMDEKLQIWKCQNEMNHSSTNWITTRVQTYEQLFYRKFLRPAMTYDNFYMQTMMNKLPCLQNIIQADGFESKNIIIAYNGTTTKAVVVNQPDFLATEENQKIEDITEPQSSANIGDLLVNKLTNAVQPMKKKNYQKYQIQIHLIAKKQNIILNQITATTTLQSNLASKINNMVSQQANLIRRENYKISQQKSLQAGFNNEIMGKGTFNEVDVRESLIADNEIQELVFMGKIDKSLVHFKGSSKNDLKHIYVRQYIIRRKRSLEIMITNGLSFQTHHIFNSMVPSPLLIYDVVLSHDKQKLIAFYSTEHGENAIYRTFRLGQKNLFEYYEDEQSRRMQNPKNVKMDQYGNLYEIIIELNYSKKGKKQPIEHMQVDRQEHVLKISIPHSILIDEMFDKKPNSKERNIFERVVQSADGRLIMCGQTVIQLNKQSDDIDNIGCFVYEKDNSNNIQYKFLNLIKDRLQVESHLIRRNNRIIRFDPASPPISPMEKPHVMYLTNCFDELTGDTSVMKIKTNNLECFELYQSNFKIQNISMNDLKNDQDFNYEEDRNEAGGKGTVSSYDRSPVPISQSLVWNQSDAVRFKEGKGKKKHKKIHKKTYISLLSQSQNQINLEIISDPNIDNIEEDNKSATIDESSDERSLSPKKYRQDVRPRRQSISKKLTMQITEVLVKKRLETNIRQFPLQAQLEQFINISTREDIQLGSEIGWINANQMILTLNNELYLMNLKHTDLTKVKNGIMYGIQQVSMGLFCSLVRKHQSRFCPVHSAESEKEREMIQFTHKREQKIIKNQIIESQQSILRMEIASLKRFAFLRVAFVTSNEDTRALLFFTPTEELNGSNIFSQVSRHIRVMQPYLDLIDHQFIQQMNTNVQNIAMYVNKKFTIINNVKMNFSLIFKDDVIAKQINESGSISVNNQEQYIANQGTVHMYQKDISGRSVIDYAFQKKAIFSIKAFVETLLILKDEQQFRNCFDKAILLMIDNDMDVKELVNSELFYPQIWQNKIIFSKNQETVYAPFNGDLEDLEFESPDCLFSKLDGIKHQANEEGLDHLNKSIQNISNQVQGKKKKTENKHELYEMKFHYISLKELEGNDKKSIMKTLKECNDIELFSQEVIKHIIDYKWDAYGRNFQLVKFYIYFLFLVIYYIDLESIHLSEHIPGKLRIKDNNYYFQKGITAFIQFIFLLYEAFQAYTEGSDYFFDKWNYLEMTGMFLFFSGMILDLSEPRVTDNMRIIFVFSTQFCLIKIVYLVRVFKSLNFLVTMIENVVSEVRFFMVLFGCFLLTFAECNHILKVDISAYGRTPELLAHFLAMLRQSMGDFNPDMFQGFDIITEFDEDGKPLVYRHSYKIMIFTWVVFCFTVFMMFMIFMNFIIAVIGDTYQSVYKYKDEFDYKQRVTMICEREAHFGEQKFADKNCFPDVLIVRKKKDNEEVATNNWQSWMNTFKNHIRLQTNQTIETVSIKAREQKQHFNNSIKKLENDIFTITSNMESIFQEIRKLSDKNEDHCHDDSSSSMSQGSGTTMQAEQKPKGRKKSPLKRNDHQKPKVVINNIMDRPTRQSPPSNMRKSSNIFDGVEPKRNASFDEKNNSEISTIPGNAKELAQLGGFIAKKFQDMDTQMLILMEMQKQNQELIKRTILKQDIMASEQDKNMKIMISKMQINLQDFKKSASEMLSPVSFTEQDIMSIRGQQIMQQLGGPNFGNLPMSRHQAEYPTSTSPMANQKQTKKKKKGDHQRDSVAHIVSFNESLNMNRHEFTQPSVKKQQRPKSSNEVVNVQMEGESNEDSSEIIRGRSRDNERKRAWKM